MAATLPNKLSNDSRHTFPNMKEAETNLFRTLKEALVKPPLLELYRSDLTYVLDTDACDKQLGTILMQSCKDKSLLPMGYYSSTLKEAERN